MTPEYEAMRRRNALALQMMNQNQVNPNNGPWSAVANLGQTLVGAYMARKFGDQEQAALTADREKQRQVLADVMAKSSAGDRPGAMGALSQMPGVDYGNLAATLATAEPKKRETVSVDGVPYYADTAKPVIPGATGGGTQLERNLRAAGFEAGTPQYAEAMQRYLFKPASQTVVNMPGEKYQSEFEKASGKMFAEDYSSIMRAGSSAAQNDARLRRFEELAGKVSTGKLTPATTQVKAFGKSLGVDLEALGITDDVAPAQALDSLATQLSMDLIQQTKGAVSDFEAKKFMDAVPSLSRTPEGNRLLIETMRRANDLARQQSKMARNYVRQNGRFDDGYYAELEAFHAQNPLFTPEIEKQIGSISAAPAPQVGQPTEEVEAVNPQTGQTAVFRNGAWVDKQTGQRIK